MERNPTWSNQAEFVLSCIGYAVGLGNLWRFPYLCMRNGGGAFLIPYFIFLFVCGIPLFFMEISIGQFSGLSPIDVWKLCPLFQGIGWGMSIASALMIYYVPLIMTWTLYYLFMSFNKVLPWSHCNNEWNTEYCSLRIKATNITVMETMNNTDVVNVTKHDPSAVLRTAAEEFWEFRVLQRSSGIGDFGGVRWELLGCHSLAWIIVFLCLIKGIRSSGKVVYVTATFPYIFLSILLILGLTLPGSMDGIRYFIVPDFKKLSQFKTWLEACMQNFYSIGMAFGVVVTMSSHNKFSYNCLRHAFIVPLVNNFTSLFAGFVIFSILGFMANETGLPMHAVSNSGPGLVFMAYPQAISLLPCPQIWAVLFFLMMLSMGIDTVFSHVEVVAATLTGQFAVLKHRKTLVTFLSCMAFLLLGFPLVTKAGLYYFQIVDWYATLYAVTFLGFLECIVIAWIYGTSRFYDDIEMMIGSKLNPVWKYLWRGVTPAILLVVFVFSFVLMSSPTYGTYKYPSWALAIGLVLAALPLLPLPVCAVTQIVAKKGSLLKRIKDSTQPAPDWTASTSKYDVPDSHPDTKEFSYDMKCMREENGLPVQITKCTV